MSDPGHHGHVQSGDGPGQDLGVEGGQVGSRSATTDEGDHVGPVGGDNVQGLGQVHGRPVALDPGVVLQDGEREPATGQLLPEVGVGGRSDAGHQADAQRWNRDRVGPVGCEEGLVGQDPEQPFAFGGQAAQREAGVDAVHDQLEATAGRVEVDPGPDADLQVVGQGQAARLRQRAVHPLPGVPEQGHVEPGGDGSARLVRWFDQVEVGVARAGVVEVGNLALNPQVAGKERGQAFLQKFAQLADGHHRRFVDRRLGLRGHGGDPTDRARPPFRGADRPAGCHGVFTA